MAEWGQGGLTEVTLKQVPGGEGMRQRGRVLGGVTGRRPPLEGVWFPLRGLNSVPAAAIALGG